jgi:hypothetical protein
MSTRIRTDVLSMSKLLLLIERGFFEIYKEKYDKMIGNFHQVNKNVKVKIESDNRMFSTI